jgi:hypothetical protein
MQAQPFEHGHVRPLRVGELDSVQGNLAAQLVLWHDAARVRDGRRAREELKDACAAALGLAHREEGTGEFGDGRDEHDLERFEGGELAEMELAADDQQHAVPERALDRKGHDEAAHRTSAQHSRSTPRDTVRPNGRPTDCHRWVVVGG